MYNATLKHNLECGIFAMCVSEGALSRTNDLLDYLYCELDLNDYLDVLEYTLGQIDLVDEDLGTIVAIDLVDEDIATIVAKIYRVAFDRE
jgi:uncharacterized protein YuzB (UPF0349 family)